MYCLILNKYPETIAEWERENGIVVSFYYQYRYFTAVSVEEAVKNYRSLNSFHKVKGQKIGAFGIGVDLDECIFRYGFIKEELDRMEAMKFNEQK